jgi:cardiolipin synthase (CMP-forming)
MTIPNFISLGRVILVPVIFYLLLENQTEAALYVFLIAGISDGVDGFLAKRYGWATELGAYLDPLADKLLLVCMFAAMAKQELLPLWLAIAVISRDILIVLGVTLTWIMGQPVNIKPHNVSKANTAAQIVLVATVLADEAYKFGLGNVRLGLIWLTFVLTMASLGAYTVAWIRHMSGEAEPVEPL